MLVATIFNHKQISLRLKKSYFLFVRAFPIQVIHSANTSIGQCIFSAIYLFLIIYHSLSHISCSFYRSKSLFIICTSSGKTNMLFVINLKMIYISMFWWKMSSLLMSLSPMDWQIQKMYWFLVRTPTITYKILQLNFLFQLKIK